LRLSNGNPALLVLGCLSVLGGVYVSGQPYHNNTAVWFLVGIVLIGAWWFTKKHVVSIRSNGGAAMNFEVGQMAAEQVEHFIDKVQGAKNEKSGGVERLG
jgi:hypothetical protein